MKKNSARIWTCCFYLISAKTWNVSLNDLSVSKVNYLTLDCHKAKSNINQLVLFVFIDLILYIPVNNFSVMMRRVFLG